MATQLTNFRAAATVLAAFFCAVLLTTAGLRADEVEAEFRKVKQKLIQDLRSPTWAVRSAAVKKFEEFPIPDAANTLLLQGNLTRFPDVRNGCFAVLRSYRNSEPVAKVLLAEVLRDLKTKQVNDDTSLRLFVMLAADNPEVKTLAKKALDELEKNPQGPYLIVSAIDRLALLADQPSAQSIYNLVEHPLVNNHSGLKRAAVQAICRLNEKEAVGRLIDYHLASEGETRADIERRLYELSGLTAEDKPDWSVWWQEKKEKFTFTLPTAPKKEEGLFAGAVPKSENVPTYYGLPLYGSRIVFIIDYSGSMAGAKMDAAKRELQGAVAALPVAVKFNIVAFHTEVIPWKRELQHVTPQIRQEAIQWIGSGNPTKMTNSYGALEAGLGQDCDAIYFLTDGSPTVGKFTNPAQILEHIGRQNRLRRATINALGIGVGPEGNTFDTFLKALAADNFGVYRRLD